LMSAQTCLVTDSSSASGPTAGSGTAGPHEQERHSTAQHSNQAERCS
jgi:hypothetical protein